MQIFEIRIFGNVSGFSEMKLGTGNHLMDGSTIKMIDYESIQTDAFSIAYAPEYYVLSYHFTFPHSASSSFRSQRASASIVIKRGFKLISPLETLKKIKSALVGYANSMKGNFPQLLASKTKDLYALVEQEIATAPEQAMLNWSANGAVSKAIIAFDEENQLSKLLNSPFRREFRLDSEHGVILLIYRKQASALWSQLKDRYKAIKIENYDAVDQIEVEFPDGHRMFVDGRNAEIDYALYKNYYKNYHFKGSLSEKMNEWKVRVIGNRYIIGVTLEPEVREYQVRFVDAWTGDDCIPQTVSFSLGKFDNKRRVLKLTGEENAKTFAVQVSEDFHVVDTRRTDNKIIVKLEKQYTYPTEQIWGALIKQGVKIPEFCIEDASGKKRYRITNHAVYHFPLPHEKAFVVFPETEKTLETRYKYEVNSPNNFVIQRKHLTDVSFELSPEFLANSNWRKKNVTLKYGLPEKNFKEVTIDCSPYRLGAFPDGIVQYVCSARGYNTIKGHVELSPKIESAKVLLEFKPTICARVFKVLKKHRFILLSFFVGLLLGQLFTCSSGRGKTEYYVPQQSSENQFIIDSLKNQIDILQRELTNLNDEVQAMRLTTKQQLSISNSKVPKEVDDNGMRHPDVIRRIIHMPNNEKHKLMKKGSFVYEKLYMKLSDMERKEMDKVIRHPAFTTANIPANIKTAHEALKYLDNFYE